MALFGGRVGRLTEELAYVISAGTSAKCGRPAPMTRAVVAFKSSYLLDGDFMIFEDQNRFSCQIRSMLVSTWAHIAEICM